MALCGKGITKKIRHGCFPGTGMYSPDAYMLTKKSSRRPKKMKRKEEKLYGFKDEWAKENEALENDSCCVYDTDIKPKKLNLVESIVIEEDCSWFTPRSCHTLPTRGFATKSIIKCKSQKSSVYKTGSLKTENKRKPSNSQIHHDTPEIPIKDIKNKISCNESSNDKQKTIKDIQSEKKNLHSTVSATKNEPRKEQIRIPLTGLSTRKEVAFKNTSLVHNKKPICMKSPGIGQRPSNAIKTPLIEIQNRKEEHLSCNKNTNNRDKETKHFITNSSTAVSSSKEKNKNASPQMVNENVKHTKTATNKSINSSSRELQVPQHNKDINSDKVGPPFIGVINGPKPHVVISETVKKENIKCKLMYCGNLPEKKMLFFEDAIPDINDKLMCLEELETTKHMEEHALKEAVVLPACDESVAISGRLLLTMSAVSDAASTGTINPLTDDTTKQSCNPGSNIISNVKSDVTIGDTSTQTSCTDSCSKSLIDSIFLATNVASMTDITSVCTPLTDISSIDNFTNSIGDTEVNSVRSVSSIGTTFTNVTPMTSTSDLSSVIAKNTHSKSKEMVTPSKNCLQSAITADKNLKYYSPTLAKLKMQKKKSVAKLVKAFENLDCKNTHVELFKDQPMATSIVKESKFKDPTPELTKITDVAPKHSNKVDFHNGIHSNQNKDASSMVPSYELQQSSSSENSNSCKLDWKSLLSVKNKIEKTCNNFRENSIQEVPEKLSMLWSANMLDNYTSDDFSVEQGVEVIVLNEDDPKWLYVQIAITVNHRAKSKQKMAGFVPRSLAIPRFPSSATRSSYCSLDSRKKPTHYKQKSSLVGSKDHLFMQDTKSPVKKHLKTLAITTDAEHQATQSSNMKQVIKSQSFWIDSNIIESYIVIKDHRANQKDEMDVVAGEVVVVHAGLQKELDWMWVYEPKAKMFGYIPAFCARPLALEFTLPKYLYL